MRGCVGARGRKRGGKIKQDKASPQRFRDPWETPTDVALKINLWRAAKLQCLPGLLACCDCVAAAR